MPHGSNVYSQTCKSGYYWVTMNLLHSRKAIEKPLLFSTSEKLFTIIIKHSTSQPSQTDLCSDFPSVTAFRYLQIRHKGIREKLRILNV